VKEFKYFPFFKIMYICMMHISVCSYKRYVNILLTAMNSWDMRLMSKMLFWNMFLNSALLKIFDFYNVSFVLWWQKLTNFVAVVWKVSASIVEVHYVYFWSGGFTEFYNLYSGIYSRQNGSKTALCLSTRVIQILNLGHQSTKINYLKFK
jgi:hypothetical protein